MVVGQKDVLLEVWGKSRASISTGMRGHEERKEGHGTSKSCRHARSKPKSGFDCPMVKVRFRQK